MMLVSRKSSLCRGHKIRDDEDACFTTKIVPSNKRRKREDSRAKAFSPVVSFQRLTFCFFSAEGLNVLLVPSGSTATRVNQNFFRLPHHEN